MKIVNLEPCYVWTSANLRIFGIYVQRSHHTVLLDSFVYHTRDFETKRASIFMLPDGRIAWRPNYRAEEFNEEFDSFEEF